MTTGSVVDQESLIIDYAFPDLPRVYKIVKLSIESEVKGVAAIDKLDILNN